MSIKLTVDTLYNGGVSERILQELNNTLLTTKETMQLLNCSRSTLYLLGKNKKILIPRRMNGKNVYLQSEIDNYLQNSPKASAYLTPQEIREKMK